MPKTTRLQNAQAQAGGLPIAPEIEHSLLVLDQIDKVARDLYRRRITSGEYREQVCQLILGLNDTGARMHAAPHIDEDLLEENDEHGTQSN
jgi:hypothetical protein